MSLQELVDLGVDACDLSGEEGDLLVEQVQQDCAARGGAAVLGAGALGQQIDAYFRGELKDFDVPLDLVGTPFQQSVWQALLNIPYGQTRSYAQQAATIGRPTAVRAVAAANGQNKVSIIVPCHRVIGSSGQLTGYGGGLPRKQWLLGLERGETDLLPLPPAGEGGG